VIYSNNCSLCRFEKAKKKIGTKYDEIERSLIEEFVKAHRSDDKGRMKEIATILSHFKGYPQCVDAFIEQSQMVMFSGENVVCVLLLIFCVLPISFSLIWFYVES
jgi:Exocyst complex component Sec10.